MYKIIGMLSQLEIAEMCARSGANRHVAARDVHNGGELVRRAAEMRSSGLRWVEERVPDGWVF